MGSQLKILPAIVLLMLIGCNKPDAGSPLPVTPQPSSPPPKISRLGGLLTQTSKPVPCDTLALELARRILELGVAGQLEPSDLEGTNIAPGISVKNQTDKLCLILEETL